MNSSRFGFKVRPPRALKAKYAQKSEKIDKRPALKKFAENNLHKKLEEFTYDKYLLTPKGVTIPTLQRTVKRILNCSTQFASTEKTLVNMSTGESQTRKYSLMNNSCGVHLVCPVCSEKRTRRIQARYLPQIKELSKGKFMYSVTFTIKNTPTFLDGYNKLKTGLRKFRLKGQKDRNGEASKIDAGLYNIEILDGTIPGTYHIHAHSLFITNQKLDYSIYDNKKKQSIIHSYESTLNRTPDKNELLSAVKDAMLINGIMVPVSKISREWYESTQGSGINIHVKPIKNNDEKKVESAIREILKYNSKINEMNTNQIYEILRDKKGLRLFDTWGKLRTECIAIEDEIFQEDSETTKVILSEPDIEVYNKLENSFGPTKRTGLLKFVNHLKDNYEELKKYRANVNVVRAEKDKMIKNIMSNYHESTRELVLYDELPIRKTVILEIDKINMVYHMFLKWYFKFLLKLEVRGYETLEVHFMGDAEQSIMSQFMKRINKQME